MSVGRLDSEQRAYAVRRYDGVRGRLEEAETARYLGLLLDRAPGARVLDLGCGDGLVARLTAKRLDSYLGVDLFPPDSVEGAPVAEFAERDLRDGLAGLDAESFDLYLGTFGVASHLRPGELDELLAELVAVARPGSIVALEGLGLFSLEWPRLWSVPAGEQERLLPYQLADETTVHPWSATELCDRFAVAGIEVLETRDSSIQFGPKIGPQGYWPGLPPLREALNGLLAGDNQLRPALSAPLPPLPAHPAAAVHHGLAAQRAILAGDQRLGAEAVGLAAWNSDPALGGGYGHRLLVVGVVS